MDSVKLISKGRLASRSTIAFTLVELLVVITIIGILTAISLPSIVSVLRGSQLVQGEEIIENHLSYARQLALTKNETTTVRFYQFADPTVSGETAGTANTGKFRGIQVFEGITGATPATKASRLPPSIIMDKGTGTLATTLSSLLDTSNGQSVTAAGAGDPSIFSLGTAYNYVAIQFKPDGSTSLNFTSNWFLTLHSITVADAATAAPINYYTVQLDPSYGHITTFRP